MNIGEIAKISLDHTSENSKPQESLTNDANYQWVVPLIEGAQPHPRGGHTATKVGRYIIFFGVC
jgi:hypothetical protein